MAEERYLRFPAEVLDTMRHGRLQGGVLSLSWIEKLRKFAARFTEDPDSRKDVYAGMGVTYTLLALAWFLIDVTWGIAWSALAGAAWGLAYLNWRKSRGPFEKLSDIGGSKRIHLFEQQDD